MCLAPQTYVWIDEFGKRRTTRAGCGKCLQCLQDYQNGWKIRLSEEFAETCKGVFFTLTYAPESAPLSFDRETGEIIESDEFCEFIDSNDNRVLSLRMEDVQDWLKRCRERYARTFPNDERPKWKYFITGEYGPKTLRPHYHGVFFGLDLLAFQTHFLHDWQDRFGFVDCSAIEISEGKSPQRVANYVSKYCAKGEFESPRVALGYVEKPRKLISKGIGSAFADRIKEDKLCGYYEVSMPSPRYSQEFSFKYLPDLPPVDYAFIRYRCDLSRRDRLAELVFSPLSKAHNPYEFATYVPKRTKVKPSASNHWHTSIPTVPRTYVRPLRSVVENIIEKMKIVYTDIETNESYPYKMPRYIKARIYGERSAISEEIKEVLQDRNDALYRRKFQELQTRYPSWTAAQIDNYLDCEENRLRKSRTTSARQTLNTFYNQSLY